MHRVLAEGFNLKVGLAEWSEATWFPIPVIIIVLQTLSEVWVMVE